MTKINPYFLIGTLGMLFTAILNITVPIFFPEAGDLPFLSGLYLVSLLFILIGTVVMINRRDPKKPLMV